MSNTEGERESLFFCFEQLAEYIVRMERRLNDLSQQFNNWPELQYLAELKDALAQKTWQFNEGSVLPEASVEVVNLLIEVAAWVDDIPQQTIQVQQSELQLVFDRSGSRAVLIEALDSATERLIIVCPWLNRNSIDANLMQKFRDCLNRNCRIDIGWGYLSDRNRIGIGWRYDAVRDLRQLERDYPGQFRLKLLGTHEKFLVCDSTLAMLGSHNMLTSSAQSAEREVGIRTTDPDIIQGLIDRFDGAEAQDVQPIDKPLTAVSVSLDDAEPDEDEDTDYFAEHSQDPIIDTEEFFRRYNNKERDYRGMNLTGVRLQVDANLNEFNLSRANLSGINLTRPQLLKADLSEANLSQANLCGANLTKANLVKARLLQAHLNGAILSQANLYGANLTAAFLSRAILIQANLKYANLTAADLSNAQLRDAVLNSANLSGANLTGVNLVGINFHGVNLSGANLSNANLCGVYAANGNLSGVNLTKADLRGANLERANLEKANLTEANLSGANLKEAKLSGAIMPDGTVHD